MRATLESDFNDFLADLDKVSVKLRDKFSGDVDRASGKLQRLTDSLDGNRTFQQAGLMVAALARVGGAATLTDRELARIAPTVDEAVQKFNRLGIDVPKDLAALKTELDRLRQPLVAAKAEASSLQSALGTLGAPIAQGLGLGAGLTIAGSLESVASTVRDQFSDVVRLGDEYSRLRLGFDALQGSVLRGDDTLRLLRESARGLVTDIQLIQQASQASVLGLDKLGANMGEVVAISTRLGAALGKDATQSIDQFSLALAKGSSERLDELGISLRLNEAYDEYAVRLGKTADKLTELEKKQAFAQIALERGREVVAKLGDVSLTTGQQVERIGVAFDNLKTAIGAGAVGGGPIADFLGGVADEAARIVDEVDAAKRALRGLAGLIPEGARPQAGLASGLGAGLTEAVINQYFGSNRAALQMLRRDADRLQRFGVIDPTLPEPTSGPIRERDGSTRPAATPFDLTSLVPKLPQLNFGEREMDLADRQIDRALDEQKRLNDKAERLDKERQRLNDARQKRLDSLSGKAIVAEALSGFDDLSAVDLNGTKESVLKVFDDLVQAREVAKRLEPNAVAGITGLLEVLATKPEVAESVRKAGEAILKPLSDPSQLNTLLQQGSGFKNAGVLAGKELTEGLTGGLSRLRNGRILNELAIFTLPKIDIPNSGGQYAAVADNAERTTLIFQEMKKSLEGLGIPLDDINKRTLEAIKKGRDWRGAVSGVAQAFSQLAQIAGGAFDNISRSIGTVFGAADAALETVTALGKQFKSLLGKDGEGLSSGGKALGGALAGLGVGSQLGGLFTNRGAGFGAGAAGGAVAGGLAGGLVGAGVGALVGGFAGLFAAAANAAAQRAAKDISASQLTAQFGGLDALLDVVGRLGLNQQTFLERFYGSPKEFGKAVTELNTALEKERLEADKLVKSLQAVARAQGVLSVGQINAISATRPGSPAEGPLAEFFAAQRQQAADGLSRAVEALSRNASLSQAETEALTKGVRDQEERDRILEDALGRKAKQTLTDFGAGAKAASAGLFVLFDEAVRRGDSAVDALSNLREPIGQLRDLYARAGITPGAGFQQLSGLFDIATGDQTGTAVQLASGLGSALSAFQNQGLLSQDLFADLTSGISESYFTLEALGKGGLDAARLMQPGLQSIFQLQKDFGFEVDANTQKLLDFAESSGLIGDQFRPAAELMVDGINDVIDRLDVLIQTLGGELPEASGRAGRSMDRNLDPSGAKTPSLPSVPDPGGNGGVPDPAAFRVEIGDTTVSVTLDGDQVAEAVVRRIPALVERVR